MAVDDDHGDIRGYATGRQVATGTGARGSGGGGSTSTMVVVVVVVISTVVSHVLEERGA